MKVVSACLAGAKCRYDGNAVPCRYVMQLMQEGQALPVCPEQLGGLPTPRTSAEIVGGRVMTRDNTDLTDTFEKGAEEALRLALLAGCDEAILKSNSPSCGYGRVYDGTFTGKKKEGKGVFAALLEKNGIKIYTDEEVRDK
jgi:uncharacterized protein YbbK (DUF523 family)